MIGFPAINWQFPKNPVIFRVTDTFALTWYGLIIAVGFALAVVYCLRLCKHFGLLQDEIIDMLFFATPAGIIGARLYYVAFNWEIYSKDPVSIVRTWEGGMAIYGGIIGAVIAAGLFCWVRHIKFGAILDIGAVGLLIGQAAGRWGNFVNGEVYGTETTLPWRMSIYGQEVHPLFLYESLWNISGLVLLRLFMRHRKYNGQMFTLYVAWYGLGRGIMEGMRNTEFNLMFGSMKVSQVLAFTSCVAALVIFFFMTVFKKHGDILAWTAERDEYAAYRKERKAGNAQATEETSVSEPQEEPQEQAEKDGREGDENDSEWDFSFKGDKE